MMKSLIWIFALIAAIVWSLFAWGAYGALGFVGEWARANADIVTGHPETVVWLSWAAGLLTSIGLAGVIIVWLIGLVPLLALPALVGFFLRRKQGKKAWKEMPFPEWSNDGRRWNGERPRSPKRLPDWKRLMKSLSD